MASPRPSNSTSPDTFMPYFGHRFESAVKGYPGFIKWSYLACLWHYWSHTKCNGIPNIESYMFKVSECEKDQWTEVKEALFSANSFFKLGTDGRWHQKFCALLHAEKMLKYSALVEKAKKGAAGRWGQKETALDRIPQAMPLAMPQALPEGIPQGMPNSCHADTDAEVQRYKQTKVGFPTLEEVKAYASMQNIQEADAEKFWHHFESTGWIDKNGHAVVRWQSKLIGWRTQAQTVELSGNSNGHGTGSVKLIVYSKELDRVNEAIRKIVDGASRDAFGTAMYDPLQKDKLMKLKSRRKELQGILGVTI